jgi:translation elongation factor EF-Tu-like GTPase
MGEILIEDIFTITGIGTVVVGRVVEGIIKVGDEIIVGNKVAKVAAIEKSHKMLNYATANEPIGIHLKDVSKNDVKPGTKYTFRTP